MIEFHYETIFKLEDETKYMDWLGRVIASEGNYVCKLNYIFCTDEYLLEKNQRYLNHDTYTDVITFEYSSGDELVGDVFISIDRLRENSYKYTVQFENELKRVMVHGLLHLMGYNDKLNKEKLTMRHKEEEKIKLFHVEQ